MACCVLDDFTVNGDKYGEYFPPRSEINAKQQANVCDANIVWAASLSENFLNEKSTATNPDDIMKNSRELVRYVFLKNDENDIIRETMGKSMITKYL